MLNEQMIWSIFFLPLASFIIIALIVIASIFINVSPQFGSNPNVEQIKHYSTFLNFKNGKFKNLEETKLFTSDMKMSEFFSLFHQSISIIMVLSIAYE